MLTYQRSSQSSSRILAKVWIPMGNLRRGELTAVVLGIVFINVLLTAMAFQVTLNDESPLGARASCPHCAGGTPALPGVVLLFLRYFTLRISQIGL